jgi:hypothetical protein
VSEVNENVGDICVDGKFDVSLGSEYEGCLVDRYDFSPAIFDDPDEP